jgi:hypothetical protein
MARKTLWVAGIRQAATKRAEILVTIGMDAYPGGASDAGMSGWVGET